MYGCFYPTDFPSSSVLSSHSTGYREMPSGRGSLFGSEDELGDVSYFIPDAFPFLRHVEQSGVLGGKGWWDNMRVIR